MENNKRWPLVVLIATVQLSVFMFAVATMVNWASDQQPQTMPGWWSLLVLLTSLIGVAGIGLMMSMSMRVDRDNEASNLDLEQQISVKTSELSRTQNAIIFGLAKLAESRDTDTGEHLDRIREYVTILATDLSTKYPQFDESAIRNLGFASSLHDVGKVGIPDSILLKPGRLTDGERKVMEHHTVIGGECLEAIQQRLGENEFMEMAREVAWWHHERWDGTGYPHQLVGDEIPLVARIVSVADVYDALTSKRPYKRAMSHAESREILLEGKGSQFDPDVIEAFLRHEEEFERISIPQKDISDEDCISGLQRLADSVEALRCETSNLLNRETLAKSQDKNNKAKTEDTESTA
ncbi:HD-GYP domain-containing protein [Mariniblastus fucicola]|uniref:Cyclic di-GMP phosphodiesterase response regulator RpfG n=1 Tax=Mariniblastus fucicola TaxID=980251 RepID=A0A5B9P8R8_9BACT|nr:HD domain-containing phosphohydrolase [Mariniblastus fucicola]QEG21312.1 Cyclic di-GMP phosphodiesterase response regulator RpfG [Mariniblastus fucicola]